MSFHRFRNSQTPPIQSVVIDTNMVSMRHWFLPLRRRSRRCSRLEKTLRLFWNDSSYPAQRTWLKTRCRAFLMPARVPAAKEHCLMQNWTACTRRTWTCVNWSISGTCLWTWVCAARTCSNWWSCHWKNLWRANHLIWSCNASRQQLFWFLGSCSLAHCGPHQN